MKTSKEPLNLSGRVFVDKLLALEHPRLALGRSLGKGDIKLLCVAKRAKGMPTYAGFFVAYVHDGNGWRKLALRDGAAFKSTYDSTAERARLLQELVQGLRSLKARQCLWGDKAFWVASVQPQAPEVVITSGGTTPDPARKDARKADAATPGQQLLLFG